MWIKNQQLHKEYETADLQGPRSSESYGKSVPSKGEMNTKVTLAGFDCSRCFSHNNSADRIKEEEKQLRINIYGRVL
ncbi:hypothetical protein [Peribacillus butanolivorans]|uniref:hypothetical protein n=1 Tax=Peribacillus butanolivorans TaxID=421767 RepID=UPI003811EA0B